MPAPVLPPADAKRRSKGQTQQTPAGQGSSTPSTGTSKSPVPRLKSPGTTDVTVSGAHIGTVNVSALRKFLISKGYDLPKNNNSGVLGRRLAAAVNDWGPSKLPKKFGGTNAVQTLLQSRGWHSDAETGRQKPQLFNPSIGASSKVAKPVSTVVTPGGNITPDTRAAGSGGGTYDEGSLLSALSAIGSVPIDEALAKSGAQPLDAEKTAEALAGLQYDSQLRDLAHQGDVNKLQTEQNTHDIGSWYDQALASQKTAASRDSAITKAGQGSVKSSDAAILASLGGDASGGASTVANTEAADEGTLAALGATQDQYNQDIQPIITQERAGQLSGERAAGTTRASDLAIALANAKGDRGGSVASHLMDIREYNNTIKDNQLQRLLQIKQTNQQQDQQNFQNVLAVKQANLAALATGAKVASALHKPVKGSFGDTPTSVKSMVAKNAYGALSGLGANDQVLAKQRIAAAIRNAGWNPASPEVAQWAQGVYGGWQSSVNQ